jgi:DNA excision repair protein ERCC-8
MNSLLLERSLGNVGPNAFARTQTTTLLSSFSAAPRFRFDGGERGVGQPSSSSSTSSQVGGRGHGGDTARASLWAHQAGVSALALERFDGRLWVKSAMIYFIVIP